MTDPDDRWADVGTAVGRRMAALGLLQADVARLTGLSVVTIRPITAGRPSNSRPATLAKVARALRWPPDAIQRLLAGEDPSTFDDEPPPTGGGNIVALPQRSGEAGADQEQVELAALVGQLPPDKRAAIEQLVRTMLEDH